MSKRGFLLIVLSGLHLLTTSRGENEIPDSCPTNARVNLAGEVPDDFGIVRKSGNVFPPESRWNQGGEMFGCLCGDKACLPLCCPVDMVNVDGICVKDGKPTPVNFSAIYPADTTIDGVQVNAENFRIVALDPCGNADAGYLLEPDINTYDDFYLLKTGAIYLPKDFDGIVYRFDEYCFWRFENSTTYSPKVCFDYKPPSRISDRIIHVGMIVSGPLLFVAFIAYAILPEMKNLYGLTVKGYVGCLFVGYTSMAIVMQNPSISEGSCAFAAYITLFSFLASFYWLNVMCFHVWWTFRRSRLPHQRVKLGKRKKCLIYSSYVWGCAILYTVLYVNADLFEEIPGTLFRPEFAGVNGCWFRNNIVAQTFYFYGPLGVTAICNTFFLINLAVRRNCDSRDTMRLVESAGSEGQDDNNHWYYLCLKLFVAMIINWSMEAVWWFCNNACPSYLRSITNFGHGFHGIIVFVILICRKDVIRLIIKRFGCRVPNFLSAQNPPRNSRRSTTSDNTDAAISTSPSL